VFGAQLNEPKLHEILTGLIQEKRPADEDGICLTILNSSANPIALTKKDFNADWLHPYVSTEIGGILPKWEAACYLLTPDALLLSTRAAQWKLGLMVLAVLAAALVGAALLWMEARRRWLEARLKSDFVSQVSHELKTPLTSIRMFSDLLVTNASTPDPTKTQRYAEVISQEAGRLSRLINSVLDFSRLERGDLPMQCQSEKLNRIVQEVVEHYRPHLESLGFQLNVQLPASEIAVSADADRISQVLLNLLCNAEKYSGEGREIDVSLEKSSSSLAVLTVADRGPGVPAGKEKRIFEKFYRAHDSLHSGIPGTGLGLALARQIARAHQGDLTYKRRPGGGSQFILSIPILRSE
jgi:signal transduction histidine kinase